MSAVASIGSIEMILRKFKSPILSKLWSLRFSWLMWSHRTAVPDLYIRRIEVMRLMLGISEENSNGDLRIHREPIDLVCLPCGPRGAERWMSASILPRWEAMHSAAKAEGVTLFVKSAFRSVDEQAQIIREQLSAGTSITTVLRWVAVPGYSEHQSGRALDIGTDVGDEQFELSDAFKWLSNNAAVFGFVMSYPKNNSKGIIFEPWHWYCRYGQDD